MGSNITSFAFASFAIFSLAISGCGGNNFEPVSGTITYEGKPVSKLRVCFSPEPVGDNFSPGPYSQGITDEGGNFTLVTRHKDPGALIGSHKLTFQYTDISETAMGDLRQNMEEAKELGDKAEFAETKKKIAKMQAKLKGRPVLRGCETIIDVPAGGIENLKMELSEMMKK